MKNWLIALLFVMSWEFCLGQNGLIAYVSFDDCTPTDVLGNITGVIGGQPNCDCGILGNGLRLDGIDDFISWSGTVLTNLLESDFTISFYIKDSGFPAIEDIFSFRKDCGIDSAFAITYDSGSNRLISQFLEVTQRTSVLNGPLNQMHCWHHIVFKKEGRTTSLFADGQLLNDRSNTTPLRFALNVALQLANSPCLGVTDSRFSGVIDELRIYNRSLNFGEISALFLNPDRIRTNDTTIILGADVTINLTPTCADQFTWSPSSGVSSPSVANPVISAPISTTYHLLMSDADCTTTDSIRINVIDPQLIDCRDVLLPSAFTPNGDGLNDVFGISNPIVISGEAKFEIFDKWGGQVFLSDNKSAKWDGMFRGKQVNPGVFLYRITYQCEGKEVLKKGSVTVLR